MFFAFQIYGDFSGYSDIALGTARLFGIELLRNFAFPYFSRDIAEFWRRWHISLSSWFKDYVYIPLGGSKVGIWKKIRNVVIIFLISGFWHGANWTFIVWGLLNAIYILPSVLVDRNRSNIDTVAEGRGLPNVKEFLSICLTFSLTVFAWIFFRSESLTQAFSIVSKLFSISLFEKPFIEKFELGMITFFFIAFLIFIEWKGRTQQYAIAQILSQRTKLYRLCFYYFLIFSIFIFAGSDQQFIYFQF